MSQSATGAVARNLAPGDEFAGHQIIEVIAKGGRSIVYKALHVASEEHRALKILAGTVSAREAARFQEAFNERLPSVEHASLERTLAAGVTDDGRVWFSAELLAGRSLETRLPGGALSAEEATVIAAKLARGLQALHERGYLHRNLKPSNVLELGDGTVRLLDVGLSTCSPKDHPLATPQTTSPEEITRSAVDARADVYSLGALVFQLVTGQSPFEGSTVQEVLNGHLHQPPPRLRALKPSAVALGDIVNRAMSKRPSNRFQTMAEMADALDNAGRHQTPAIPEGAASPPKAQNREHRGLLVVGGVGVLVAVLALVACWLMGLF